MAGLVWLWIGAQDRRGGRALAPPTPPAAKREPESRPARGELRAPSATPEPEEERESESLEPFTPARTSGAEFRGPSGSLRGHVEVTGEEPFPKVWRLVARPSRLLPGREHAVERVLAFDDGRQDFELADLPLGGYDVFGEAEGFNGQILPVLLQRGDEHPFVNLRLVPAGVLEGRVLDAQGLVAEGIPITLFAQPGEVAREVLTDAQGRFRFEQLPDGAYDLLVGKEAAPLLPERRPVRFAAPHLTFPDIELPPLGEIHVSVVDSLARPLEGVEVRGSGSNGGQFEGRTDFEGRLVVRHLPAGRFRLRLEHPAFDPSFVRRVAVDVVAGQVTEAPVRLGP